MTAGHPVSALMFVTFGIVIVALIGAFVWFMRKPSNRNAGDRMPERGEPGAPDKPRGEPLTGAEARK